MTHGTKPSHHELESLLSDIRIRFGLRERAVRVLRVMIRDGEREDDGWHYRASEPQIADAAGCSQKTASRGIEDLHKAALVSFPRYQKGVTKRYRVRLEVINGEAEFFDPPPRQQPLTRVTASADPGQPNPGQTDPGHRGGEGGAPSTQSAEGGQRARFQSERERENNSLSHSSGGVGGPDLTSLPTLPEAAHDRDLPPVEVSAALASWAHQHGLQEHVEPILAAVLAARFKRPTSVQLYVETCLRRGVRDHWLRTARDIINPPEVTSDSRNHSRTDHNPARIRDARHAEQRRQQRIIDL